MYTSVRVVCVFSVCVHLCVYVLCVCTVVSRKSVHLRKSAHPATFGPISDQMSILLRANFICVANEMYLFERHSPIRYGYQG